MATKKEITSILQANAKYWEYFGNVMEKYGKILKKGKIKDNHLSAN